MLDNRKFHSELKQLMDEFAHFVYDISSSFPKEERFGLTSQIRRAAMSVVLNYVEGYARQRKNVLKNFLEISYGSLKETVYLLGFSYKRGLIDENKYKDAFQMSDRIGRMLWGIMIRL